MVPTPPFHTSFAEDLYKVRYKHPDDGDWNGTTRRVVTAVMGELYKAPKAQKHVGYINDLHERVGKLMSRRQFIPGGRYLYSAGRDLHQVNNCVLLRPEDNRESLSDLARNAKMALMTGAGIGVWYGDIRAAGSPISRTGGEAGGPLAEAITTNEIGRGVISGGQRRSAIWAGLPWWHADIFDFIKCKDWPAELRDLKQKSLNGETSMSPDEVKLPMDFTNISVSLDDEFFEFYNEPIHPKLTMLAFFDEHGFNAPDDSSWESWAKRVYETTVAHMVTSGEPGFTVDVGKNRGEVCRNACTEITSADDSDVCNLGHLVLPRFESVAEWRQAIQDCVMFLTAGSLYSDLPYDKVGEIRDKNRRLGLGQMGGHEFIMRHRLKYGTDGAFELLEPYMEEYARALEYANELQSSLGIGLSVGATSTAPTGTTGVVGETTAGWDPMFSASEIRTVRRASAHGDTREQHVVVDPTAARLVASGIPADLIEDAYTLSLQPERRFAQQAFVQDYTDHSISSTVNIHAQITDPREQKDFGAELMKHLPRMRGVTVYPDGAIPGQPRKPCDLEWALANAGKKLEMNEAACKGSVCGG